MDSNGISTNISSIPLGRRTAAKLLDSGNLELRDMSSGDLLWQSFDYPSDTFLPGMKLGFDDVTGRVWTLSSWRSTSDPSPGQFQVILDPNRTTEFLTMQGSQKYWTSGPWTGQVFLYVPEIRTNGVYMFGRDGDL
ncbi:hypothetical protein Scep_008918 [Stephania cephalantha]|uniref:Bulb-type lectin domain-containing protein n=1 Tax=Stephania cephalantha TaxID=152367 RepID=A0AAP0PCL9_9MAGN